MSRDIALLCKENGIKVPGQVCILGIDNNPIHLEKLDIEVSSIDMNDLKCGYEAAKLLHRIIREGKTSSSDTVYIEPMEIITYHQLSKAEKTASLIEQTQRYIATHLKQGVKIDDLCRELDMPRSSLHLFFIDNLGIPPGEEIIRQQIATAKDLLANTQQKIEVIAFSCGYSSSRVLAKTFKNRTGVSPCEFRKGKRTRAGKRDL